MGRKEIITNYDVIVNKINALPKDIKRKLIPRINVELRSISRLMQYDVVRRYYIDPKFLKSKFQLKEAKGTDPFAEIRVASKTLGLEYFRVRKSGRYISTGVRRDLGVKEHKDYFFFQHGTIFQRYASKDKYEETGKTRNSSGIRRMYGPSVVGLVDNNDLPGRVAAVFYKRLGKDIEKILEEELDD